MKIYNFGKAKVKNILNAASIYIIYHTNKFSINTIEGLGILLNSLFLRQSELYHLHPLNLCITIGALFCLSNYYIINYAVHFII
jgi:hypothetical protein